VGPEVEEACANLKPGTFLRSTHGSRALLTCRRCEDRRGRSVGEPALPHRGGGLRRG
jgi:hypothetical protein